MSNRTHKSGRIEIQKREHTGCRIHPFLLVYNLCISRILPVDILVFIAGINTLHFIQVILREALSVSTAWVYSGIFPNLVGDCSRNLEGQDWSYIGDCGRCLNHTKMSCPSTRLGCCRSGGCLGCKAKAIWSGCPARPGWCQ